MQTDIVIMGKEAFTKIYNMIFGSGFCSKKQICYSRISGYQ